MPNKNKGLVELFQSKGLLFPINSEEVTEFENQNNIENENPKDWENPIDIILRGKQQLQNIKLNPNSISSLEIQNLAMAARDGSTITDEVRKKMNEDRNNATKK